MKRLIPLLIICFLIPGCRNDRSRDAMMMSLGGHETDTTFYPLLIDGGTKIVYQVGHLTPDKGLKLYYDTIAYPEGGFILQDSVRVQLSAQVVAE